MHLFVPVYVHPCGSHWIYGNIYVHMDRCMWIHAYAWMYVCNQKCTCTTYISMIDKYISLFVYFSTYQYIYMVKNVYHDIRLIITFIRIHIISYIIYTSWISPSLHFEGLPQHRDPEGRPSLDATEAILPTGQALQGREARQTLQHLQQSSLGDILWPQTGRGRQRGKPHDVVVDVEILGDLQGLSGLRLSWCCDCVAC